MILKNHVHLGDCLHLLKLIPENSIGMILSDMPYGKTRNDWDKIIDMSLLWPHYMRIIRPGGAIVLTAVQPFSSYLVTSNPSWHKFDWIIKKSSPTGHLNSKIMPLRVHEQALVFGKGKITYNPQMSRKPLTKIRKSITYRQSSNWGTYAGEVNRTIPTDMRYPQSIIEFNTAYHDGEAGLHPNQKPVSLFSYLIRTHSNPDDTILDNAAGSGTTAIAAINNGLDWICIEKEHKYYQIANKRIADRLQQPFLL